MKLEILPVTADLWPALEDLFGERGACNGCWCMYWRIGAGYRKRGVTSALLAAAIKAAKRARAPQLEAYPTKAPAAVTGKRYRRVCRSLANFDAAQARVTA
jgi:hypothetical protein